jgi:hypothetical protein
MVAKRTIAVTQTHVRAARLRIEVDKKRGHATPEAIVAIANARPERPGYASVTTP